VDDSATVVTQVNPITATVTATDPTASEEGPDTGELTVNLNAPASEGGLIVDYAVGGTASTQEDYTALSGSVSIPEGQTSATITVTPIDDTVLEGTETVVVTLESGIGYEVGSPDSATVNILDSEISLSKVQGDGQIGSTGVPLDPFVVELLDGSGAPSPGVTVGWTLEAGDGTLSNETSSTDAQGRASTVLTPGEDTGYEVRATIDALSVSVTFNVLSDPLIVDGLNPPQREVAETVERLCPLLAQEAEIRTLTPEEQDLLDQCTALLQNSQSNPGAVREAIAAITPEEANAPAELTTRVMNTQLDNVMGRLGALRQGARGGSLTGLAFNIGGQTVPGTLLASLVPYAEGNDSANDEEGLAFGPLGVFITGSINIGDRSGSSNEAGFDFDTKGITAGVDYRFTDDLVLGVAVGYANTDVDLDNNGGDLDVNAWSASVYGTYYVMKELYVEGLASYQRDDYDQVRNVAYSLLGQQRKAKADYYGNGYTLSLGAGYDFDRGALNLGVYGRAAYTDSEIDDYRESGASGLDLKIDDQEVKSFTTSMGGRMSYAFTVTKLRAVLFPQGWFEWEHEFEDGDDKIKGVFANDPNRIKFALPTDRLDSDYFRLGLGLSAQFAHGRAAFISYETKLGADDLNEHNFSVGVRFEF
jgi:outer membrane autotransporter protein